MEFYYWVGGLAITIFHKFLWLFFPSQLEQLEAMKSSKTCPVCRRFWSVNKLRPLWLIRWRLDVDWQSEEQLMFQKPLKNTTHTLSSHMCFLGVPFLWTNDSWNCGRTETSSLIAMWTVQSGHTPKSLVNIAPGTAQFTWTKTGTISDPFAGNHIVFTVFCDTARWHAKCCQNGCTIHTTTAIISHASALNLHSDTCLGFRTRRTWSRVTYVPCCVFKPASVHFWFPSFSNQWKSSQPIYLESCWYIVILISIIHQFLQKSYIHIYFILPIMWYPD